MSSSDSQNSSNNHPKAPTHLSSQQPKNLTHIEKPSGILKPSAFSLPNSRRKSRVRRPHSKSRQGCLSCKKLRIKCDEAKPKCEYCQSTNRVCEYPQVTTEDSSESLPSNDDGLPKIAIPPRPLPQLIPFLTPLVTPPGGPLPGASLIPFKNFRSPTPSSSSQQSNQQFFHTLTSSTGIRNPVPSSTRLEQMSELHRQVDEENSTQVVKYDSSNNPDFLSVEPPTVIYSPIPTVATEIHRNMPLGEVFEFYLSTISRTISLNEPQLYVVWNGFVPQMAYSTPMVSHALIAYTALNMYKNLPNPEPNLEKLAFSRFHIAIRLLSKALNNLHWDNYEAVHITSCLIAAFAFNEPEIAPLVSRSPSLPDLFSIMRGCFNISRQGFTDVRKSPIDDLLNDQIDAFPTFDDLKSFDPTDENVSYYKLLLDQLESMKNGSKDISILCGPNYKGKKSTHSRSKGTNFGLSSRSSKISPDTCNEWTSVNETFVRNSEHSTPEKFSPNEDKKSPSSPEAQSIKEEKDRYESPNTDDDTSNLFTLLPGELEVYLVVIYSLMFMAKKAVFHQQPNILVTALNVSPDDYVRYLKLGRPMALIIAAYTLGQYQFMSAYPVYSNSFIPRLHQLESALAPEWHPALYWPKTILEEGTYHDGLLTLMKDLKIA